MEALLKALGASKLESHLLVLFIPSTDKDHHDIDQEVWVARALEILGSRLGGATAYPRGLGVWRDDKRGGRLLYDKPVVIQCYTHLEAIESAAPDLRAFLVDMATNTNQAAVGFVIDGSYLEIQIA